jgi:hypothetical protein
VATMHLLLLEIFTDLQNTTKKMKDWATWTPIKTGVNSDAVEGLAVPAPIVTLVVLLLMDTNFIWYVNRIGHHFN